MQLRRIRPDAVGRLPAEAAPRHERRDRPATHLFLFRYSAPLREGAPAFVAQGAAQRRMATKENEMRRVKRFGLRGLLVAAVLGLAAVGGGIGAGHQATPVHADMSWCAGC